MSYNKFSRGRTPPQPPPFDFDDPMRPIPIHGDFDNPYMVPSHMLDRPNRAFPGGQPPHAMDMPPMHLHPNPPPHIPPSMMPRPYIEGQGHNYKKYPPNFSEPHYDRPSPSGSYIGPPMNYGDPHATNLHNPIYPHEARSSSPPYKILCITNINQKISDDTVKETLTSDFNRFGDISVSVCHDSGDRLAYIYFRNCDDAREARQFKIRTIFFDRPIEIEPIYEPIRGANSPDGSSPSSPMVQPSSGPPIYSPRRRSASPPKYHRDMTDPMAFRTHGPLHMQAGTEPPPPPSHMYPQHHGLSPISYNSGNPSYPHTGRTPPSMMPTHYDRRNHPGPQNYYRSPHIMSPYSSPTHEQYRSSYRSPPNRSPYPVSSPVANPHERPFIPSVSPHHEAYYMNEARGLPSSRSAHSQHHPSSRAYSSAQHAPQPSPSHQPYGSHSSRRGPPTSSRHADYPSDPPARFMSREFRRERYGSNHHPHEHDDTRPSRVLLINNLDAAKAEKDLRETFEPFGIIEEMEIKAIAPDISSALIKFSSMDGAYKAKTANNGRHIGNLRCRIVYGKVNASKRLWIGGLSPSTTVTSMERECGRYGDVASMEYTSGRPYCYVEYETANQAQFAAHQLRTTLTPAPERKIRIEFVDPDRSEKLAPRLDPELGSKSRAEAAFESEASPRSAVGVGNRKRSISPVNDKPVSKRLCQVSTDIPSMSASTFKQERLAVMAAKARTSSTTSSLGSHPVSDKSDKIRHEASVCNELNNNSDNNAIDNGDCSTPNGTPIESNPLIQEGFSHERLSSCSSIKDMIQCCPVSWPGQMALRNFIFPAQIYMCSGQKHVIDRYFSKPRGSNGDSSTPILRITQRWRLHPQPKLEEVKRRMQSGNLGLLILTARQEMSTPSRQSAINCSSHRSIFDKATQQQNNFPQQNGDPCKSSPCSAVKADNSLDKMDAPFADGGNANGSDSKHCNTEISANDRINTNEAQDTPQDQAIATPATGPATQTRPLRNLISYLEQKDAAGVVALHVVNPSEQGSSGSENSSKLLYAFPPGDFALNLLKRKAPNLLPDSSREEYLLGVIVGGNVDCAKT